MFTIEETKAAAYRYISEAFMNDQSERQIDAIYVGCDYETRNLIVSREIDQLDDIYNWLDEAIDAIYSKVLSKCDGSDNVRPFVVRFSLSPIISPPVYGKVCPTAVADEMEDPLYRLTIGLAPVDIRYLRPANDRIRKE